jgi:hypothetical protein
MTLKEVAEIVARERMSGEWTAYHILGIAMDATRDPTLASYIETARERRSLNTEQLEDLRKSHTPSNGLDFVHFVLIHGNIDLVFVYVYVVELWSSNYLAAMWEVHLTADVDLSKFEYIADSCDLH